MKNMVFASYNLQLEQALIDLRKLCKDKYSMMAFDEVAKEIKSLRFALRHLAKRSSIYCEQDECCARRSDKFSEGGNKLADEDCISCQIEKAREKRGRVVGSELK